MGKREPFKVVTTTDSKGRSMTTTVNAREEAALRAAGRPVKVELDEQGVENVVQKFQKFGRR